MALKMTIEPVAPFNGLDVLVARDEGLFAAEGLDLTLARRLPDGRGTEHGSLATPQTSQGMLVDRGQAAMFQG
jgi:hypothetical protein